MLFSPQILDCRPEMAIKNFASARPPGIYKQDYIVDFFELFGDGDGAPEAPPRPAWCFG